MYLVLKISNSKCKLWRTSRGCEEKDMTVNEECEN
jgi:hypothetical protein